MNEIVRYLSLGLTLGSALKMTVIAASWQGVAVLGILAVVTLVLHEANHAEERKALKAELESVRVRLNTVEKDTESTKNEMSALRMNKGITTRRIG